MVLGTRDICAVFQHNFDGYIMRNLKNAMNVVIKKQCFTLLPDWVPSYAPEAIQQVIDFPPEWLIYLQKKHDDYQLALKMLQHVQCAK